MTPSNKSPREWKNLGIKEVDYGFGWQTAGDPSTDTICNCLDRAETEITALRKQLEDARSVIEFYSDRNSWKLQSYGSECKDVILFSDLGCKSFNEEADFACSSGGRRAREWLSKYPTSEASSGGEE